MARTTSISNWDFEQFHVQEELEGADFINAASTLIAAGPARLKTAGDSRLAQGRVIDAAELDEVNEFAYPVGVIENATVAQNKQLQRLFEIGSKRSYFITGRNIGSITIARTLFHGPSLLRAMYAYYPPSRINTTVGRLLTPRERTEESAIRNNPGFADFFINLDSDLFDHPIGLMFYFRDSSNENYGAFYLEDAYINNHQFSVSSSSVLVAEGITVQYDQMIPIDVNARTRRSVERNIVGEVSDVIGDVQEVIRD